MADGNQGAFLASSGRQPFVLGGEIGVLGFRRDLGNFDEDLPQPAIAFARLPTQALPSTLVVPWTHPRPRGEMLGAGETAHIGASLRDEALGCPLPDPRDRIQEGNGLLLRRPPLVNFPTDARDRLVQVLQRALSQILLRGL